MTIEKKFPALSDFQITETMRKKGGGFVSRLGVLFRYADDARPESQDKGIAATKNKGRGIGTVRAGCRWTHRNAGIAETHLRRNKQSGA